MANWDLPKKEAELDEYRVMRSFCQWLEAQGWAVEVEKDYVDVVAERGDEKLYAEVKGKSRGRPGVELDTLYGQLLRRMPSDELGERRQDSQ